MLSCQHGWRSAVFAGLIAVLALGSARAADTGNGSKNFHTPPSVPNYFSNEAGPMLGAAAESRRTELYMSQTYAIPRAPQSAAAETPRSRQHVAMAEPRGRSVRTQGRRNARTARSPRVVAHHVTVHGRQVTRVVAHGSTRSHSASRSAHTTSTKPARVGSSHRRAHR